MQRRVLFFLVVVLLFPVVRAQEPYADAISLSVSPETARPGEVVTLTWEVRRRGELNRADHVVIRLSHPVLYPPVYYDDLPFSGTLEVTIPDNYYDLAEFQLSFRDANGSDLRQRDRRLIFVETEIVVDDDVDILYFTAAPETIDRGGSVTLSWEVTNKDTVMLSYLGLDNIYQFEQYPAKGSVTLTVPDVFTTAYRYTIGTEGTMGAAVVVHIRCPFKDYTAAACPLTAENIEVTYQPFEHGTMYQWGDSGKIFILYDPYDRVSADTGGYRSFEIHPLNPVMIEETPPEGLFLPAPEFAEVWLNEINVRETLGWATGEVAVYTTHRETARETAGKYPYIAEYFYRPDGALIHTEGNPLYWRVISAEE